MSDPTNTRTQSKALGPAGGDETKGNPSEYIAKSLARACYARYLAELFSIDEPAAYERLGEDTLYCELSAAATLLSIDSAQLRPLFADRPAFDDMLDERNRLLGHTVRSACPPYELEYGQGEVFQQSQRLADI